MDQGGGRQWPVTDHDVLGGRGVTISQHVGNERFRALVFSRADADYCSTYTTEEKRAIAEEIVDHINSLDPPGRFLKRPKGFGSGSNRGSGRTTSNGASGLAGLWEEISRNEAIKKTCQALRDCNRRDRTGYGVSVVVKDLPRDVAEVWQSHAQSGMTKKQLAEQAATESSKRKAVEPSTSLTQESEEQQDQLHDQGESAAFGITMADFATPTAAAPHHLPPSSLGRPGHQDGFPPPGIASFAQSLMSMDHSSFPPSPKKQRLMLPEVTPSTGMAGTVAGAAAADARAHPSSEHHSPSIMFEDTSPLEPLPGFVLASTFDNDAKPRASSFDTDVKLRASSFDNSNDAKPHAGGAYLGDSIGDEDTYRALSEHDFGPPSPTYDQEPPLQDYDDEP